MVIRLRRLPMPLRVLCVLLALLLLTGTVFAPVAQAEALTATIALLGGAALVSGVLAAAGLKASDSAAWDSWCSQIAASDSVRTAAQALSKITLPAAKLVALVYAGKTYVSKTLHRAIINEAISAGAYAVSDGGFTVDAKALDGYLAFPVSCYDIHFYNSVELHNSSTTIYFPAVADVVYVVCKNIRNYAESSTDYVVCIMSKTVSSLSYTRNGSSTNVTLRGWDYNDGKFNMAAWSFSSVFTSATISHIVYNGKYYGCNACIDDIGTILYRGKAIASSAGVQGVTQQEGAITDPIGKDVIGSLDDLKTKVADWSDYLDTGVDVAIDGAVEGVASEAVPSLPVTIPAAGQQGVQTYPDARTGTTDSTIIGTGTDTATVSENQSVVSKLLSNVIDYIQPDTGFFSKFPLCIPYDVYLFFSSLSGKDMSNNSIFSSTPGSLGISNTAELDTLAADQWEPVLDIDQDWSISGFTIPFHIHLDFTSFQPVFDLIRVSIGAFFVFDLIIYEWNRTRGE